MVTKLERKWNQRVKELKAYKRKHRDCLVPKGYKHNPKLANWVVTQRVQYQLWLKREQSTLTKGRIVQLNKIDFVWVVGCGVRDKRWKQRLEELKAYKKKHGNCIVPNIYEDNAQLGKWVTTQRNQYNNLQKGLHSHLTEERIHQLNNVGFVWRVRPFAKSIDAKKSKQENSIPSVRCRNGTSTKTKSNLPKKRQIPSKDKNRPRKTQRRQQSQNVGRELSQSERKERKRLMVQALKSWRNPMRPVEEFLSDDF